MILKQLSNIPHKQKGVTLFTALVFLTLMTIVSVSATRISMLDILVAGNNQQQMLLFQTTENDLKELTTVIKLYEPLIQNKNSQRTSWVHILDVDVNKPGTSEKIRNDVKQYQCGGFNGQAVSMGPDVPPCYLFDFEVVSKNANSSVRDRHNRGAGKEFPNISKHSYLQSNTQ